MTAWFTTVIPAMMMHHHHHRHQVHVRFDDIASWFDQVFQEVEALLALLGKNEVCVVIEMPEHPNAGTMGSYLDAFCQGIEARVVMDYSNAFFFTQARLP
jgi:hypothetical protein